MQKSVIVDRYLYPSGSEISLDSCGLLLTADYLLKYSNIVTFDEFSKLPGAIIVAEGGIGKTTLMNKLKDQYPAGNCLLIRLGEYNGDPTGLRDEIASHIEKFTNDEVKPAIIFDGLDEAEDLWGILLRLFRSYRENATIWFASRDASVIRSIIEEHKDVKTYILAPLSKDNVKTMALARGLDGDNFIEMIYKQDIAGICAKPLGCDLALSLAKSGELEGKTQKEIWQLGIERLCDENPSITKHANRACQYTNEQICKCASWIALCSSLTEKAYIWNDEDSYSKPQSITLSELVSNEFPKDLIQYTLERGVFSPLGDGRIRFSHQVYKDYLSAYGFYLFIFPDKWEYFLLSQNRSQFYKKYTSIVSWLASFNRGFLKVISEVQPELLLPSPEVIDMIGRGKICKLLITRSNDLSIRQLRSEVIWKNLFRLKSPETIEIIKKTFKDKSSTQSMIEIATSITEECEIHEMSDILIDFVLDEKLSLYRRIDAVRAVYILKEKIDCSKLRNVLPIDKSLDSSFQLRGYILACLWPCYISSEELGQHLIKSPRNNFIGQYHFFLKYDLPETFQETLTKDNALPLLQWSIDNIDRSDYHSDPVTFCAKAVFSHCWQWIDDPEVFNVLANGYIKILKCHISPFLSKEDVKDSYHRSNNILILDKCDFHKDVESRMRMLEFILNTNEIANIHRMVSSIYSYDYPIYTSDDFKILYDKVLASLDEISSEKWGHCIKDIIWQIDHDKYKNEINDLNCKFPELIPSFESIQKQREVNRQKRLENEGKNKREELRELKEQERNQLKIDQLVKKILAQKDLQRSDLKNICVYLNSNDGFARPAGVRLPDTNGWKKLTKMEREILVSNIENFLINGQVEPTEPNCIDYFIFQTFDLLRTEKTKAYYCLPRKTWEQFSTELIKIVYNDKTANLLAPIWDAMATKFPDVFNLAFSNAVRQELDSGIISKLRYWKGITEEQVDIFIDIAIGHSKGTKIFEALVDLGETEAVKKHLNILFNEIEDIPKAENSEHFAWVFFLMPNIYIDLLIKFIYINRKWGREWFEKILCRHEDDFANGVFQCSPDKISQIYIWLHSEYPSEHEGGYSPCALDEIHDLKRNIINFLTDNGEKGSANALQSIYKKFPDDIWLKSCILDAKSNELSRHSSKISIVDLKELLNNKNMKSSLINSIDDLHSLVMSSLDDYQVYLQGDIPTIGNLWNTAKGYISPKDEETFSDHLANFLILTLPSIIINREVQIRRKQFSSDNAEAGSRTDIWIQAIDKKNQVLTLCIEVKCNWNPSAKTALKEQLIEKYLSGAKAEGGILLLGWFECNEWDNADSRKDKAVKVWSDIMSAKDDLRSQAELEGNSNIIVSAKAIDCSLR